MINNDFLNEDKELDIKPQPQSKAQRIEAYNRMRNNYQKLIPKEKLNRLAKMNQDTKENGYPLRIKNDNVQVVNKIDDVFIHKGNSMRNVNNKMELINKYEEYAKELMNYNKINENYIANNEIENEQSNENITIDNIDSNEKSNIVFKYAFTSLSSFVYHKGEKWFAYTSNNLIVIEDFSIESNRTQTFLKNSDDELTSLKMSSNNKIIFAFTSFNKTKPSFKPYILFYSYSSEHETKFALINKCMFNQDVIIDCDIAPRNNLSIVISKQGNCDFVSVLDFINNEILVTTAINIDYYNIKWNKYLKNLEFTTIATKAMTFWRINTSDGALQYQQANFDFNEIDYELTCIEFMKPLNSNDNIVVLLVGCSNGDVLSFDTKTNSMIASFKNVSNQRMISSIITTMNSVVFVVDNTILFYDINYEAAKSTTTYNYISSLFTSKQHAMSFDSKILYTDNDISTNDITVLTSKRILYYVNTEEETSVKLHRFINTEEPIIKLMLMKKTVDKYTVADDSIYNEENLNIDKSSYYIVTAHLWGTLKIWSYPESDMIYEYSTINEDIIDFDIAKTDTLIAVSYTSNNLRFFNTERTIGKFNASHLSLSSGFKFVKFLPDMRYLFVLNYDNAKTILTLVFIERYEPLLIQYHRILSLEYDVVDFQLSMVECYNKFYLNVQNVYLFVYNRKFTNIMKNLNYDNSVPQFYVQDKFNLVDYFKQYSTEIKKKAEKYKIEFVNNINEKNLIYVMSKATKRIIIRNFETHVIENMISFNDMIDSFDILQNYQYIILLYRENIQLSKMRSIFNKSKTEMIENLYENQIAMIKKDNSYQIVSSDNSSVVIVYSNNYIFVYTI